MKEYIQPLLSAVDIKDVIERCGVEVDRNGFAHCPFHSGDRNASLKVYKDNYHCYGCGASGSAIKFVQSFYGIDFHDAMRKINNDFAVGLPLDRRPTLREQARYDAAYREYRKRKAAEIAKKEAEQERYNKLVDEWCRCDIAKRTAAPDSDEYADAVKRIDYVAYLLDSLPITEER